MFRDEKIELLCSFDAYKASRGKDRASMLRFWNGGIWAWDRAKNADDPWLIPNWSAVLSG